jgi:hypothetical protein
MLLPTNAGDPSSMVTQALTIYKNIVSSNATQSPPIEQKTGDSKEWTVLHDGCVQGTPMDMTPDQKKHTPLVIINIDSLCVGIEGLAIDFLGEILSTV